MRYEIDGKEIEVQDVIPDMPTWKVVLNGREVADVENLAVINESMGIAFLYGSSMTGAPYNQGHLYNRGGTVVLPYTQMNGKYYLLVLEQSRPLQGDDYVLEFPRGQSSNISEKGEETALREFREETGIEEDLISSLAYLGSGNPDNALTLGQNVHFVAIRLERECFIWDTQDGSAEVRQEIFRPDIKSRLMEGIKNSKVVPLEGFASSSMMTMSAVGFFRAYLDH